MTDKTCMVCESNAIVWFQNRKTRNIEYSCMEHAAAIEHVMKYDHKYD